MIGDLWNNNKRRNVRTREGQRMYMGHKYSREEGTGYLVCTSGKRRRLHDVMWETEAGREIPPGCVIHHLDWDKSHNEISNLVCVTISEHNRIHNPPGGGDNKELGYKIKKERGLGIPAEYNNRECECEQNNTEGV